MTLYTVPKDKVRIYGLLGDEENADRLAQQLAAQVEDFPSTSQELDEDGRAVFSGLESGTYLLVQTQNAKGYAAASPFLVTLEDGERIEAEPKIEPISELEPSESPVVSPEPTVSPRPGVSPEPGTVVSPEPSTAVSPEPGVVSPEPSTDVSPEPSTAVSPEPSAAVSPEPSTAVSPAPSEGTTVSPSPSPEKQYSLGPFTGDLSNLQFWSTLVGLCLVALAFLLWPRNRKHE
jgi:hypothetical protein